MSDAKTEAEPHTVDIRNGALWMQQAPLRLGFDDIDHVIRETGGLMRRQNIPRQFQPIRAAALLLATAEAILLAEPMQRYDQDMIRREAEEFARQYRKEPGLP